MSLKLIASHGPKTSILETIVCTICVCLKCVQPGESITGIYSAKKSCSIWVEWSYITIVFEL